MPTDGGLTDLAATLADGQAVDWAALEAELGSEAERAIFRQLRVIAEIAELHRSLDGGESTPDDPLPVIQDPQSSGPDELPAPAGATPLESTDAPEGEPHDLGTWGPYRLLRSLGPGTLGRVVRATDHLHRDVVIGSCRRRRRPKSLSHFWPPVRPWRVYAIPTPSRCTEPSSTTIRPGW